MVSYRSNRWGRPPLKETDTPPPDEGPLPYIPEPPATDTGWSERCWVQYMAAALASFASFRHGNGVEGWDPEALAEKAAAIADAALEQQRDRIRKAREEGRR